MTQIYPDEPVYCPKIQWRQVQDPLLIDVPREILGERVRLRTYSPSDAHEIQDAIDESRADLARVFDWVGRNWTIEQRQAGLQRGAAAWTLRTEMAYGIWNREDGKYLGDIGIFGPEWRVRRFEIGYWLRSSGVGKGYATESAQLLCDLCFGLFEARRVLIQCDADNLKSAGVPRRLGFEHEGTLRNHALKPTGEPCDTMVFGITPERWKNRDPVN